MVKRFREAARERRTGDVVLLDGAHLVAEALDSQVRLDTIAVTADAASGPLADLAARCAAAGARVLTVADSLLTAMSPVRHPSGIVALAHLSGTPLDAALAEHPPQLVVFLDAVQDPGNVGAIIRTAEACGATAVAAGPGTADPFGWKALRGSMGSALRVPVASVDDLGLALRAARGAGLRIVAAVPRGGTPLGASDLSRPLGIVVGGEGAGVSHATLANVDEMLTIQIRPHVESLNVSVAAAIVLYETSRQRADVAVR